MANTDSLRITDGSTTFEGGVDSGRIPTIESPFNPTGLKRNQVAWATNATMRGGGIIQRTAWLKRIEDFANDNGLFQGGAFYTPDSGHPYIIASIGGRIYRFNVWETFSVEDIGGALTNPAGLDQSFFCQAENVMIIQAGDFVTLPLFWDGATMRRSNGIQAPSPGNAGGVYTLDPTANWIVPAIGAVTAAITLVDPYPGQVNDIGAYGALGNFQIATSVGNQITLRNIDSAFDTASVSHVPATFTVQPTQGAPSAIVSEVPAGKSMDYYMGRLWVQTSNRTYTAGDIAYRGAVPYNRQSFLEFTENAYLAGGGSFNVPSQTGAIRAIFHTASLDTALGDGQLMISTRDAIYALTVPVSRLNWNAIDNNANMPLQRVVQIRYGTTSDRSVVKVNGDVFYKSYDGYRSFQMAVRYFNQWGQLPISKNENRVLQFNDRAFDRFGSGIEFDNRMLQTVLPFQTPVGVAHKGVVALDFDLITSMQDRLPPAWEGMYEDLDILQLAEASSGGLQKAFAITHSRETGRIQVWELTNYSKFGDDGKRVTWFFELPAYTWNDPFQLKELDSAEIFLDKLLGTVNVVVDYRVDQSPCWINWHATQICTAATTCDDQDAPVCYPVGQYRECFRNLTLPKPPVQCEKCSTRPSNIGYQFQVRVTLTGWCRVRGVLLHAKPRMKQPYSGLVC